MHLNSMLYGISVGLLLTASAAFAQDRMTAAQCQGSVDAILSLSVLDPESIPSPPQVDEEGWCQLENVILEQSAYNQINAGLIRWRATGIARLIDQGLPPRALDLEVRNVTQRPIIDDPVYDYLVGLQFQNTNMGLSTSITWDGVQNALSIRDFSFELGGETMIEANARFTGVNLTDAATIQASAMQAGLVDLDLMVVNDGLFESFFIVPLGLLVLDTNSQVPPETQVQNLISASQDFIASRPDTVIPPRSKEAVTALLSDMPTPTGTLRLDFTSSEPLGMARLMPLMIAGDPPQADTLFDALFTGATLNVTWDRAARASE